MDPLPQFLRADAQDNRERLLDAARELFAETGLGVPMREIARRAEVGPATLYRRFPTKQAIVGAAFADELRTCRAIVERAAADPDAWRGFCSVVLEISELNARNHAFVEAFMSEYPDAIDFASHRTHLLRLLTLLAARAQASGELRTDFVIDDLILLLLAGRGVAGAPTDKRVAAARRFSALALDGFRAAERSTDLPPRVHLVRPR
jgi:AcrR family transcriptional regulator